MASLLERLKYIIEDIFGKKTYAESQRDKYKKVVRNLEKELKKTDNLSDVMAQLATDYNTMEMNPDSAQGKLSDTFVTKESDNPVQQAIDALKSHGDRVDDFYDEFQEYKDMEDMQ